MAHKEPQQLELEAVIIEPPPRKRSGTTKEHGGAPRRPAPAKLLSTPGALLTRSHLRELGLERRAIDAVFRRLPVVALPGYSRPMIRAEHYLELVEQHTYRDDRVRPSHA
ncbi:MAG TPA: hypothetical protein VKA45_05635 [Gaiellaceae bacterium]|nr:hypothetical protein [Gaiellaceae bacterium]